MGKRELVALLSLSSWCLVLGERLFLAVPLGCLRLVIVVFPDHTHLLFLGTNRTCAKICLKNSTCLGGENVGRGMESAFHVLYLTCFFVFFWNMFLKGYPLEAKTAPKN